jgi:hypothetical protein
MPEKIPNPVYRSAVLGLSIIPAIMTTRERTKNPEFLTPPKRKR